MIFEFNKVPCHYLKLRWAEQLSRKFYNDRMVGLGITGRQFTLLSFIEGQEGCSLRELADLIVLERSTVNRSVQPLIKNGLLEDRRIDGQRNSSLFLTAHGREVMKEAHVVWNAAQQEFEERMKPENLEMLSKGLDALNSLID